MNDALVDRIARAVLYEGYILYPYRPSVKNRQRWTFGGIYPRAYSEAQCGADACSMQAQCLVTSAHEEVAFRVRARFLHLVSRTIERAEFGPSGDAPTLVPVESLEVDGQSYQTWQEAVERQVDIDEFRGSGIVGSGIVGNDVVARAECWPFTFPHYRETQDLLDSSGAKVGRIVREQQAIEGIVECSVERKAPGVWRMTVSTLNRTPYSATSSMSRDDALMHSFVSSHLALGVRGGEFISLTDPPESLAALAAECRNVGCWPVLVGEPAATDTMLASPIILGDYPQIAPESPGDLFDSAEIDEILTLRILTLTDDEKRQMAGVDERARALLDRTESLSQQQMARLHGTLRELRPVAAEARRA